jgi:hypothetical protein
MDLSDTGSTSSSKKSKKGNQLEEFGDKIIAALTAPPPAAGPSGPTATLFLLFTFYFLPF